MKRLSAGLAAAVCLSAALVAAPLADPVQALGPNGPTQLSIVMPITVPDARMGLLSAATLASYTTENGLLTRELDAVIDTPVAIGIDPLIIASIRLLGSSAPESALAWLAQLDEADNEIFALSWADADVTAPLQAGSPVVLEPKSLDHLIDPERFGPSLSTAGASPAPTGTPAPAEGSAPPLPTTESLLAWDYSLGDISWPEAGSVASTDLAAITASGFTTTVLSSGNVSLADGGVAAASINGVSAIVTDDALSELLATTTTAPTLESWQSSLASLVAAVDASGSTSRVLTLDRTAIGSVERLRATIVSLESAADLVVTPLSTVAAGTATSGELIDSPQDPERVALVASALQSEAAVAQFSEVVTDPARITAERRLSLLSTLAPTWDRYPAGWEGALASYIDRSTALRDSVRIIASSDLIFPDRGYLPFTVANDLNQAITVFVTVKPLSPLLDVENDRFEVTVEPQSQRRALVPAVARSNGLVSLEVSLSSATALPVGEPIYVRANVQAGWETPLTIGLGIAVVLIFAGGIYRTILRRRKARAAIAEDSAE